VRQVRAAAGLPPEGPPADFDATLDAASPVSDRFDRLLAAARERNPELATAAARTEAARAETSLARTRQWSDLVISVGAGPVDPNEGRTRLGWEAGFTLGLPVWDRGQGEIDARQALLEASREEEAQAAVAVAARVSRLSAALAQGEAEVRGFRDEAVPASTRRSALAADASRQGKLGREAALEASRALRETELDAAQSRLMRATASIELERVVGIAWGAGME
jgi:cobalt-zinc-cadmium efflux system outer membrane protein